MHSALKLEKSAFSKVRKNIIYFFKNGKKKSIFTPEKSLKLHFCSFKLFYGAKNGFFAIFEMVKSVFLYF